MLKPSEGFLHHGVSGKNIISPSSALRKMVFAPRKWKSPLGKLCRDFPDTELIGAGVLKMREETAKISRAR
jgi:hypothetical protein